MFWLCQCVRHEGGGCGSRDLPLSRVLLGVYICFNARDVISPFISYPHAKVMGFRVNIKLYLDLCLQRTIPKHS